MRATCLAQSQLRAGPGHPETWGTPHTLGPSSHLWNGHRLRGADLWEGAAGLTQALM